ncbi:MAG: riboflavin biosynthesis protein RibD C-domain protein [Chloroflexi bacterium]|nr:riboflavin biosynthesis protein RibD C-domain protein [Chloroflexota bacterium]
MLPHVILHTGMSVDGRIDWGVGNEGLYYELAARSNADAMLTGSRTMLAAYASPDIPQEDDEPLESRELHTLHVPLLVIVDSRGQIRGWSQIKKEPYWRNAMALCSRSTPQEYLEYLQKRRVEYIVAGDDRVDLRAALEELNARYGVKIVRVDSGGILNGALLRAGLVDEVSVLIGPCLVGGTTPRSIFVAPDLTSPEGVIPLRLIHMEAVRGDTIWLRYEVIQ